MCPREFYRSEQGFERCLGKKDKTLTKRSRRCKCKIRPIFHIKANGEWGCKKYKMIYNNEFLLMMKFICSHRKKKIENTHIDYLQKMRKNSMKVSHTYMLLRNEVGGPPLLELSKRDAYNNVCK